MKEVLMFCDYHDEKLYNIGDVVSNFKNHLGVDIDEMKKLFTNYIIWDWESVSHYLEENNVGIVESGSRYRDYSYYKKSLSILSNKGLKMIELIEYLCNYDKDNKEYEEIFDELEMFHYASIMKGKDINRILILLFHLINKFNRLFNSINNKEGYLKQHMDSFALGYGGSRVYPNEDLIVVLDNGNNSSIDMFDKSSFVVRRNKAMVRKKMVN